MSTIGEVANDIQNRLSNDHRILPYIDNEKLINATITFFGTIIKLYEEESNEKRWHEWGFWENGVDPFAIVASSIVSRKKTIQDHFKEVEVIRQRDKTISNHIGDFHQNILGALDGCTNPGKGGELDLIVNRPNLKLIAEIKNKWNTTKGDDRSQPYDKLRRRLEHDYQGYTAYYVTIIPEPRKTIYKPLDKPFAPSAEGIKRELREDIRIIDGKCLYALLTGYEGGLEMLYNVFPQLIAYCLFRSDPQLSNLEFIGKDDIYFNYLWEHIYVGANRKAPPR